jgi:hypothetical protein
VNAWKVEVDRVYDALAYLARRRLMNAFLNGFWRSL